MLTPMELQTCLLEIANLVNQRPIGRIPNDPDDGSYMLFGRASSHVSSRTVETNQEPPTPNRIRPEDSGFILKPLDKRCLPVLDPTKKMTYREAECANGLFRDGSKPGVVRGKWNVGRLINVFLGHDGRIHNVKVRRIRMTHNQDCGDLSSGKI